MPGPLYKLSLSLKGNKKPAVTTETSEAGEKKAEAVHYGVTCDGCNMVPITGVRYVQKKVMKFGAIVIRSMAKLSYLSPNHKPCLHRAPNCEL